MYVSLKSAKGSSSYFGLNLWQELKRLEIVVFSLFKFPIGTKNDVTVDQ